MLAGPSVFFAKASILLLYIRLFGLIQWIRCLVWIGMIFLFLVTWVTVPLFIVYCAPRHGAPWVAAVMSRCQRTAVLGILHGIFHVLFDIFIIVLPVPVIWNLNLEFRKKLGVLAVFMTGFMYAPQRADDYCQWPTDRSQGDRYQWLSFLLQTSDVETTRPFLECFQIIHVHVSAIRVAITITRLKESWLGLAL